jgi:hypothetical protein
MHEAQQSADSPHCLNCGSRVSKQYVRVNAPPALEARGVVRACPADECGAQRTADGRVRKARGIGKPGDDPDIASYGEATVDD